MTVDDLLAAFERIHPSHRHLEADKPRGKATHWLKLFTIPEERTEIPIPLVHFELGHGSAAALANFMLAAMEFARERKLERDKAASQSPRQESK